MDRELEPWFVLERFATLLSPVSKQCTRSVLRESGEAWDMTESNRSTKAQLHITHVCHQDIDASGSTSPMGIMRIIVLDGSFSAAFVTYPHQVELASVKRASVKKEEHAVASSDSMSSTRFHRPSLTKAISWQGDSRCTHDRFAHDMIKQDGLGLAGVIFRPMGHSESM